MAVQGGEDVYATLLLTDSYLPGALVLAHSLRDAGTSKRLAVLVTLDSVSAEVITQLKSVYDFVLPVPRIRNGHPANLYLMDRPDLHSAFTKINLWRQTQFRKIVYIDADVVAYRAPDELFDLPHAFSAAPDIGWPDLFNTGVMALTPNMGDYYAMMAMAERGISFDGADQGLLNMHFKNSFNRLSFTYNVTPSAHYQYIPAYRHFQSSINMVHFIGTDKPWLQGRHATTASSPFNEMVGRWWAVYDRHYRSESYSAPELVQYFVKGEYQPRMSYVVPVGEPVQKPGDASHGQHYQPPAPVSHREAHHEEPYGSSVQEYHRHLPEHQHQHQHHQPYQHPPEHHYYEHTQEGGSHHAPPEQQSPLPSESFRTVEGTHTEARKEQAPEQQQEAPPYQPPPHQPEHKPEPPQPPPQPSWDAQRHPPPVDARPEAINFPQTHYEMSSDPAPFVPPQRYPSPPRGMWYEVPKERPTPRTQQPRPIFPWEGHQPRASRVFAEEAFLPEHIVTKSVPTMGSGEQTAAEQSVTEPKSQLETPTTSTIQMTQSDPWSSFTRLNAWDEVPEIERYVDTLQKHRRRRSHAGSAAGGSLKLVVATGQEGSGQVPSPTQTWGRRGSRLTDFPSAFERPSLPVTPAPIRRPKFWGGGGPEGEGEDDDGQLLPAAQGVPAQSDWVCVHGNAWSPSDCLCDLTNVLRYHKDPIAQLQKLARQQSEVLLAKLGSGSGDGGGDGGEGTGADVSGPEVREIPSRPLPFGSEDSRSPTYVARSAAVLSPQPLKPPGSGSGSVVRGILVGSHEVAATPRTTATSDNTTTGLPAEPMPEPSYTGPGLVFEKDEGYPEQETPALPSEEEKDVLET